MSNDGSPHLAASSSNASACAGVIRTREGVGVATATGTMAATGLPWREMRIRFPRFASSTSSEMCVFAAAIDMVFTLTNLT
jgi:hypothetical protein